MSNLLCAVLLAITFAARAAFGVSPVAAWEWALYSFIVGGNVGLWLGRRRACSWCSGLVGL